MIISPNTYLENIGKYNFFKAIVADFRGKVDGNEQPRLSSRYKEFVKLVTTNL